MTCDLWHVSAYYSADHFTRAQHPYEIWHQDLYLLRTREHAVKFPCNSYDAIHPAGKSYSLHALKAMTVHTCAYHFGLLRRTRSEWVLKWHPQPVVSIRCLPLGTLMHRAMMAARGLCICVSSLCFLLFQMLDERCGFRVEGWGFRASISMAKKCVTYQTYTAHALRDITPRCACRCLTRFSVD